MPGKCLNPIEWYPNAQPPCKMKILSTLVKNSWKIELNFLRIALIRAKTIEPVPNTPQLIAAEEDIRTSHRRKNKPSVEGGLRRHQQEKVKQIQAAAWNAGRRNICAPPQEPMCSGRYSLRASWLDHHIPQALFGGRMGETVAGHIDLGETTENTWAKCTSGAQEKPCGLNDPGFFDPLGKRREGNWERIRNYF